MPTPTRQFRADDELWNAALEKAAAAGENVPDILRDALERYNSGTAGQHPDNVVWLVRSRPPSPNKRVKLPWTYWPPMSEAEARKQYQQTKRAMAKHSDGHEVELVRRAEFVVEQT